MLCLIVSFKCFGKEDHFCRLRTNFSAKKLSCLETQSTVNELLHLNTMAGQPSAVRLYGYTRQDNLTVMLDLAEVC